MGASGLVLPRVRGRVGYSCVAEYWVSLLLMGGRCLGVRVLWVQNPVLTLTSPAAPPFRISKGRPGRGHLVALQRMVDH